MRSIGQHIAGGKSWRWGDAIQPPAILRSLIQQT
jgi:hypothetical protein